eukprot:TRINITY_DN41158_c0_g1_i1.p1 TRINITY_DN41158_c0_g1~~TRINITY_DN41158_c0_g1_i1.p1  ORF type:complete len:272 (+),score=57.32 TRINITY_DN41158_c0_g1_i1:148-963(+)
MSSATRSFSELTSKIGFLAEGNRGKRAGDIEDAADASDADSSGADGPGIAAVGAWLTKFGLPGDALSDASAKLSSNMPMGLNEGLSSLTSFAGTAAASATKAAGNAQKMAKTAATTVQENAISRERWMYFFGGIALGTLLMSLSMAFLPMIVFAPQKFALLYTLGSLCFLSSFSILRGHGAFLRHLLSRQRVLFTLTYVSSMVGTLWASLIYRSYLLAIAFSAMQVCALSWFLVSYIPGGRRALGMASSMAWRFCKGCCRCVTGGSRMLPL